MLSGRLRALGVLCGENLSDVAGVGMVARLIDAPRDDARRHDADEGGVAAGTHQLTAGCVRLRPAADLDAAYPASRPGQHVVHHEGGTAGCLRVAIFTARAQALPVPADVDGIHLSVVGGA